MKKCPYCSEEIQEEAKKCRFCGEFLEENEKIRESIIENKKYGSFIDFLIGKGRIGRLKFFICIFILGFLYGFLTFLEFTNIFFECIVIYFATILNIKRLHDINKSWYYILPILIGAIIVSLYIIFLVKSLYGDIIINEESILIIILVYFGLLISVLWVLYSFLLGLFLTFKKGTNGPNRFGDID